MAGSPRFRRWWRCCCSGRATAGPAGRRWRSMSRPPRSPTIDSGWLARSGTSLICDQPYARSIADKLLVCALLRCAGYFRDDRGNGRFGRRSSSSAAGIWFGPARRFLIPTSESASRQRVAKWKVTALRARLPRRRPGRRPGPYPMPDRDRHALDRRHAVIIPAQDYLNADVRHLVAMDERAP